MDAALAVAGFALMTVWFALTAWLSAVGLIAGACACLFAVHLVMAQPKQRRDHVGMPAQVIALIMAVPIFAIGVGLVLWVFTRAEGG
jgi:hypothetical protein